MTAFMCFWPLLYFTVSLGCFRCTRSPLLGSVRGQKRDPNLFGRAIIFEVFQCVWKSYLNVTDGQTTYNLITALSVASRGKKISDTYPHIPYIFRNYDHRPTFCGRQYRSIFVKIFLVGSGIFVHLCKRGVSAVQGHPRSLILVPIESAYVTSY